MSSPVVSIGGGTALAGEELTPIRDARVVIEGGRIARLGATSQVTVPAGADRIDAAGLTLLPGFIDAHVHIAFSDPATVAQRGVTTVRDLGWPADEIFPLAQRSTSDAFPGARVVAAGTMLTAPGGYPTKAEWAPAGTGTEVRDLDGARDAVRANVERGAAVIKIALNPPAGPVLSAELVRAIVEAAHEAGLKVTGHIHGVAELDKALDAGIDELAHMLMGSEHIPATTIERMVAQDVTVVPTLAIRTGSDRLIAIDNLRRFREQGGRVVYGTDLGNEGPRPGIDRTEVRAMTEAEMTPLDIVRSATVDAAAWLGLDGTGILAEGARADLIGVRGDPGVSARTLTRVDLVVRGGRRLR